MLYSYTITEKFLKELAELEYNESTRICNFIELNFINKENLYLKINRKILEKKYGTQSNDKIDNLIKTLSNQVKDIFSEKKIQIDYALIGTGEKNGKIKLSCKQLLLDEKKVKKFIEDSLEEYWAGGSETEKFKKLENHFNRIFSLNSNVFFVYRFLIIPFIEINHPSYKGRIPQKMQFDSYNLFLKFLSNIRSNNNTKLKFYTCIAKRKKMEALNIKLDIKQEFEKLFKIFCKKGDQIIVKDNGPGDKYFREIFHDRLIVTFVDGPDNDNNFLPGDLNVFDCSSGMQFFENKNTTKKGMKIARQSNNVANEIWKGFRKDTENVLDFMKIVA